MSLSDNTPAKRPFVPTTARRRTRFSRISRSAVATESPTRQATTVFDIALATAISASGRPCVYAAMQTSRSVNMPTTWRAGSVIGTHPQSFSHMICAARFNESPGPQVLTSLVISSPTFISIPFLSHSPSPLGS
jgi:hypothetical protein